jgi:uncharacterized protein (TIGR02271 family)
MPDHSNETRIPIVEERARVSKQLVAGDVVRIRSSVSTHLEQLTEELTREDVVVERVAVDREIDSPPGIRQEDDLLIIPVVEERLVIEKRWVLKEELHVHKRRSTDVVEVPVALRSSEVTIEREPRPKP